MTDSFFSGAICVAAAAICMFFVRFWLRTKDPLFIFFFVAFALLALERVILASMPLRSEFTVYPYSIRLLAFGLIIAGVVHKNWTGEK